MTARIPLIARDLKRLYTGFLIAAAVLFAVCTALTGFNPGVLAANSDAFWEFITQDFLPPALPKASRIPGVLESVLVTLALALSSTTIAAILAFNDFRQACHIGTRTSLYLLQSGLVPCIHTGKRTRCYKIAKADVAAYLRRRLTEPEQYAPPSGWYKNYPQRKPPAVSLTRTLDYEIVSRLLLRRHLEQQLADAPDVLTVEQIARFTGYTPHTVSRWCTEGRLHTIQRHPRFMVPKTWLLDVLTSEDYNRITRKSREHYAMIAAAGTRQNKK